MINQLINQSAIHQHIHDSIASENNNQSIMHLFIDLLVDYYDEACLVINQQTN